MTSWTVDRQAPLSMGFFRQDYWSGLPFPPPGALPDPEIEPVSACVSCIAGVTLRLNIGNLIWEAMIRRCRARWTFHWKFIHIKFVFQRVYVYICMYMCIYMYIYIYIYIYFLVDWPLTYRENNLFKLWVMMIKAMRPRSESHFHQFFTRKQILKDSNF